MSDNLPPCPACGSTDLGTNTSYSPSFEMVNGRVHCNACGLAGPDETERTFPKWNDLCAALSGGWVRCSERMPEDGAECELTIELESGRTYISSYIFEGGRWVPADGVGPLMLWPVVAFRPVNYGRESYEGPE